ncbi:MAG TPA: lytic transglycosylase domain-containing protein [Verrucomicrobiae bacterium]|nr:lytic transglycosylase domain-containing protein [Verrucomicrobiae bacterium]
MKFYVICIACLMALLPTHAQDQTIALSNVIQNAQQWAQENLDTNVLNSLPQLDEQKVQEFLRDIQQRFNGEYVIDIAQVKQTAIAILPILESSQETMPYAVWLKANLEYLDVAEEYNLTNSPPKVEPGQSSIPISNPTPQVQRDLWIKRVATRPLPDAAKPYVTPLKYVFSRQKVPEQLIWIAEVESSFDRRAYSPAGAAGLFQLMPDTAKRFGLSLWPRDQRYQLEPSATAAAQYLKSLHDRFADWRLALAAYNAGEGTVQKLLDRYHTTDYDHISTHLPAETQMYVPKVEATILRREGIPLTKLTVPQT